MRKRTKQARAVEKRIRVGGTYRDVLRDAFVTVEDHEMIGGRRTGRVIVTGKEGVQRFPRRWLCLERELAEVLGDTRSTPNQGEPS